MFESKSEASRFDICIVGGAGHVGLPLALTFANRGQRVLVHDVNVAALETIGRGEMPFMEEGGEALLARALVERRLRLSADATEIRNARAVIVTIGTPVDEFLNPTFSMMQQCFDTLLPHLSNEQLVVLRSTVYPGTTDWLVSYLQQHGKSPLVSFCPERVVQGLAIREIAAFPQIISGTTPEAEKAASELFLLVAPEVVLLKPKEAEFAKLFANAYRYIQFAAANQMYQMANAAGVDYHRVLEGMKKDYPRARDIPRAGFAAGPCLFKDTMQLAAFSNNQFTLGHAAMLTNEGLVFYIIEEVAKRRELKTVSVGLLGMAFKPDSDDRRSSLSYKLKKLLHFRAKAVLTTDPFVRDDSELLPLDAVIERSDVIVLCVPHTPYRGLDFGEKPVIDVWGSRG